MDKICFSDVIFILLALALIARIILNEAQRIPNPLRPHMHLLSWPDTANASARRIPESDTA